MRVLGIVVFCFQRAADAEWITPVLGPVRLCGRSGVLCQLLPVTPQLPGLSNTSGVYLQSLFFCTGLCLSHLSHLAFPTLQVCIRSLFFSSVPAFTSHISVTWPFQHFRCVSAVFVFLYPPLSLMPHLQPFPTLQVCICSLFFCTHLYLSHLTYWPFQNFRCVLCWCSAKWFLYLQLVLHAISSITFSVNDGGLAWLVQVDHEWEGSCSPWIWHQCTTVAWIQPNWNGSFAANLLCHLPARRWDLLLCGCAAR